MNQDLYLEQIQLGPMENFVYLIGSNSTREVCVVDPAWDIDFLLKHINEKDLKLSSILVTHYHPDHIGGGFGAGVHSVIEPAIYGSAVCYGPNIKILDEAIEMVKNNIGFIINNYSDLIIFFNLLDNKIKLTNINKKTKNYIISKLGASKKIINEIFYKKN